MTRSGAIDHRPRRPRRPGHRLRALPWAAIAALAGFAGCSTTAPPQTFSLLPASPAASVPTAPAFDALRAAPVSVALETVAVPPAVDQPQWVVRLPDQRTVLLEQTQWASPLRDELRAALQEALAQRWVATDARPPVWRLRVDLSRFESVLGREAWLEGRWTLRPGGGSGAASAATLSCALRIREPAGAGLPALAEAHRRALLRLSDQIGPMLRVGPAAPPPDCPSSDG